MQTLVREILGHMIDYAGLFPPAALAWDVTVANYVRYRSHKFSDLLGNLIVPVDRLQELGADAPDRLPLSCLLPPCRGVDDPGLIGAMVEVERWRDQQLSMTPSRPCSLSALEVRCPDIPGICWLHEILPSDVPVFIELPLSAQLNESLDTIQRLGRLGVKVRTGGITPELIPSADSLAQFLSAVSCRKLRFKATAGLHHPLPAHRPLTYDGPEPSGQMHGFLNLLLATTWVRRDQPSLANVVQLLQDGNAAHFQVTTEAILWHDQRFHREDLLQTRREGFLSFGSCSFQEPIGDLIALSWLDCDSQVNHVAQP